MIGVTPFYNRDRNQLLKKIGEAKVVFPDKKKYKIDYSDEFVDIVIKLLNKDKKNRLGTKGDSDEILQHKFFASINIQDLLAGKIKSPLKLDKAEKGVEVDTRFFNSKSAPQDLQETLVPLANLEKVRKNDQ